LHFARSGGSPADLEGLDTRLFPYAQLSDGVLGPGEPDPGAVRRAGPGERRVPGEGSLPLRQLLGVLPAGLPLSIEIPMAKSDRFPAQAWAKLVLEKARGFLADLDRANPR
jgi:hypothetical protein